MAIIEAMPANGRFDHLRDGALELLDAGNSPASVAQVLGVPASLLARWRDEGPVTTPSQNDAATVMPTAVPAPARPISFRTTLLVKPSSSLSPGKLAYGAVYLVCVLAASVDELVRGGGHSWSDPEVRLVTAALVLAGGLYCFHLRRPRLILGPDAIIAPTLFGQESLAYPELVDWWLVSHVLHEGTDHEFEGRLLTLRPRGQGVRPLKVLFRDDELLDPEIVERLDFVKQANQGVGPLTRLGTFPNS